MINAVNDQIKNVQLGQISIEKSKKTQGLKTISKTFSKQKLNTETPNLFKLVL